MMNRIQPITPGRLRGGGAARLLVMVCACGLLSCTVLSPTGPGTTASATPPGVFGWHDLVALDAAGARTFYAGMFGWSFASSGVEGYEWIRHQGRVIGGLVDATVLEKTPRSGIWLNAVTVDDLEATVQRVEAANGRVIRAPQDIPGRGRMAVVADRDGAMLQLISGKARVTVEADPRLNRWLWAELLAGDAKDAAGFYRDCFGYEIEPRNPDYAFLVTDGAPQAGIVTNPFEETSAVWIPFVRVDDPAALSLRAEALGGRVVLAASDDLRQGSLAVILDPDGAPLAMQRWPVPDLSPLGGTP